MINRYWNFMLTLGLLMLGSALARQDSYLSELNPKAEIPGEELYSDLVDEVQKLHSQEINLLQYMGAIAARNQHQENIIQHQQQVLEQREQQQSPLADESLSSLLDELPADSAAKNLNRVGRVQTLQKPVVFKSNNEKKNNHPYMSLCHFKLCNMGRKRNTRFLHFWN